ncbi:hypothetical protein BH23ACT5_BH23ACT5_24570 [soil metagenome]
MSLPRYATFDMARPLAFGIVAAASVLWLTFFAGPGTVEVATLASATAAFVWFATADPSRLVDHRRRPHLMLFGLAALAAAVLVAASAVLATGTVFLTLAVGVVAIVTGLIRAVRHGLQPPLPEE